MQIRREGADSLWCVRVESAKGPEGLRGYGVLQELGRGGERAHELVCFVTNTSYDSEKGELRNHIFIHLSLEGELSHGESALLLLLTKSLLSSLRSQERRIANLLLSQSAAHGTGGLGTQIGGQVLGLSVVLLELRNEPRKRRTYGSSLLLAEHSQSASNVLAHDLDLSKLGRSSSSDLGNTQLHCKNCRSTEYLSEFLLVVLNLGHELITVLLTKFNSLHSGYALQPIPQIRYAFL